MRHLRDLAGNARGLAWGVVAYSRPALTRAVEWLVYQFDPHRRYP